MSGPPEDPVEVERYRPYLRVLAELEIPGPLRRRVDASDLVQETLLKAHVAAQRDPRGFEQQSAESRAAWLRKILANTLANLWRDHRAARRDLDRERSLDSLLDESALRLEGLLASREPSPSQRAMHAERVLELARALAGLPEGQRRAILLQRVHGLSLAAIAEDLGRTKDAVVGLLRRGIERLESELGEYR